MYLQHNWPCECPTLFLALRFGLTAIAVEKSFAYWLHLLQTCQGIQEQYYKIDEQTNKTDKYTTLTATQNSQRQTSELDSWPVIKPLLENCFMDNFHFGYFAKTAGELRAKNIQILFALCKMILPKSMAWIFLLLLTFRHFSLESHRCLNVWQRDLDVWCHEQFNYRFLTIPFPSSIKFDIVKWFYISGDRYLPRRDQK